MCGPQHTPKISKKSYLLLLTPLWGWPISLALDPRWSHMEDSPIDRFGLIWPPDAGCFEQLQSACPLNGINVHV